MRLVNIYLSSLIALTAGCTTGPDYKKPEMSLSDSYVNGSEISEQAVSDTWWESFNDAKLDSVVDRALSQNLDLVQAEARLVQARALSTYAGAEFLPNVNLDSSAQRIHQSEESAIGRLSNGLGAPRNYSEYSAGVQASWEIDISGRLQRNREAAMADMQAAEIDIDAVKLMVAGETADTYLVLRGLQGRLKVIDQQKQVATELLDLVGLLHREGLASERELERARSRVEYVNSLIPPIQSAIDSQLYKLDVLMGMQAGTHRDELLPNADIPAVPTPAGNITPADLLRRRPDIKAAEQRLIASNARIGSAIAGYYPNFSLTGMLGFISVGAANFATADALQSAGGAGLRWRLFDFGRVDAEVANAKGKQAEVLAIYRSTVLRATEDVESALSRYMYGAREMEALTRQIAALETTREQTQLAYEKGIVALIEVLDVDQDLLEASDRLVQAKTSFARASVAVFRALGGGWNG